MKQLAMNGFSDLFLKNEVILVLESFLGLRVQLLIAHCTLLIKNAILFKL